LVGGKAGQGFCHGGHHLAGHGVAGLGPIHGQRGYAIVA
jgi:hypothetical protein